MNDPGEAEHKIYNFIEKNIKLNSNDLNYCIYSNDSDCILLSLISK